MIKNPKRVFGVKLVLNQSFKTDDEVLNVAFLVHTALKWLLQLIVLH